jgi:Fur family zinc uptake transcriptional regulator
MPESLFPLPAHDHACCIEAAVTRAHALCQRHSVKLTPLRETVLRALLASHKALGAYEIIEHLHGQGRRLAPISVYRVIDVLLATGLVHRLESRNAFFACLAEHGDTRSLLVLICEACSRVAETSAPEAWASIEAVTRSNGFQVKSAVLEMQGVCADCGQNSGKAR